MSALSKLNSTITALGVPVETGVFSGVPPDEYIVLTPMTDDFAMYGDNAPQYEVCEVRISLFSKHNYLARVKQITSILLTAGFTITGRRYIGYETDTGYHNYATDVAHVNRWE